MADLADFTVAAAELAAGSTADLADWTWAIEVAGLPAGGGGGPSPAVAGLTAHWDASTLAGGDGTPVGFWPDVAGGGYHLAQATPGSRPTLSTTAAGHVIGGLPTLTFDGTDDYLFVTAPAVPCAYQLTLQAVVRGTPGPFNGQLFVTANGLILLTSSSVWEASDTVHTISGGTVDTAAHVVSVVYPTAGSSAIRVDGTAVVTGGTAGAALGAGFVYVGASNIPNAFFPGDVGEILYYAGVTLTAAQQQANEAYLKAKWGTP